MNPHSVKNLFCILTTYCDLDCVVQGPNGRPGMIGQPGVVGEKVKNWTVTLFDYRNSLFLVFLTHSFCLSKGEDGEAGDPGSVGVPGRTVSCFFFLLYFDQRHPTMFSC